MILTSDMYVPALRWRQGEYQALFRLSSDAKDRIAPLLTIPEIEFDFEEWRPKKSVQEHVNPFPIRYMKKWGKRPAWIGVHKSIVLTAMDDGRDIFTFVFEELRKADANAVPAIPLGADAATVAAVAAVVAQDSLGVGVQVRLEDLMKSNPKADVEAFVSRLGAVLSDADLIVDLGAPNFDPYVAFSGALIAALGKLGDLNRFRNLVIVGTAIPESFKAIGKGSDEIPRHDWLFYRALLSKLPIGWRIPNFGDYTIVHPEFTPVDMRKIRSAGKLVYTTSDKWWVEKGGSFRDNPGQMHGHCAKLVGQKIYRGSTYSHGDDYIAKCAVMKAGPSNQTRWKNVAINHHITHVLDDLSMLSGAP